METAMKENYALIRDYLFQHLKDVLKKPYNKFTHPFIDPGSNYDGNLWDWDSFWAVFSMMNVAENSPVDNEYRALLETHAQGNVLNFLDFQMDDGYIPMMVDGKEEGTPYLIRKHAEGTILNMHKPFLCQQICLISGMKGNFDWIAGKLEQLERYFDCYDHYYFFENCGLYVWADDVMIGMDNDPASFGRPRFSTANIFLNSFMVREFRSMAKILFGYGQKERAEYYEEKARRLAQAIQDECWDKRDKFFYSVDVDIKARAYDWFHVGLGVFWKTLFIKTRAWSSFLPMLVGVATDEQAKEMVRHITDPDTFWSPNGVRTLSCDEKMYNLEATQNPSNWLGPIWIIVQYAVFRALLNYGYRSEAEALCENVLNMLGDDLRKTGTLHEFYNPETGEPIYNPDFINWNILALNMADELDGKPSIDRYLPFDKLF